MIASYVSLRRRHPSRPLASEISSSPLNATISKDIFFSRPVLASEAKLLDQRALKSLTNTDKALSKGRLGPSAAPRHHVFGTMRQSNPPHRLVDLI